MQEDKAFKNAEFRQFCDELSIVTIFLPPRMHRNNILEPKYGIIRSLYSRLRNANADLDPRLISYCAVRISNDMFGSGVLSAFELYRGVSKPIMQGKGTIKILDRLIKPHEPIIAKRKLHLMLRSKSPDTNITLKIGDLVQLFIKVPTDKRGKWTNPHPLVHYEKRVEAITVPGSNGKTISAAFEETRLYKNEEELPNLLSMSMDELDDMIDDDVQKIVQLHQYVH